MANKVVVDVPSVPKGDPVEVLYLGEFANGATHDLTDEQVATYEAVSQTQFPSSGYLFAGAPRTKKQEEAAAENVEEIESREVEETTLTPPESKVN